MECLEQALKTGAYGVWGGATDSERATLKRTRDTAAFIAGVRAIEQRLKEIAAAKPEPEAGAPAPRPTAKVPEAPKRRRLRRAAVPYPIDPPDAPATVTTPRPRPPTHAASTEQPAPPRRRGPTPTTERFWSKVNKTDDCWTWTGGRTFCVQTRPKQVVVYPYRYAYELLHGPIAEGVWLRRECATPQCVRPEHFRLLSTEKQISA